VIARLPPDSPTIAYLMELFEGCELDQKVEIAKRIKATNKDIKFIEFLDDLFQAVQWEREGQPVDLYRWAYLLAHPDIQSGLDIYTARLGDEEKKEFTQKIATRKKRLDPHVKRLQESRPLVSAVLLQQKGVKPGKQMGILLKEAEKAAINEDLNDPGAILEKLAHMPIWRAGTQ
jgi:poly(A) polymerase